MQLDPAGAQRVIFVAGADFSGSTVLDLMLGSLEGVSSLGEVSSLAEPTHPSHEKLFCTCQRSNCNQWQVDAGVPSYRHLLAIRGAHTGIDSSKHPWWIAKRAKLAREEGMSVSFVLVWKDPSSYAQSCAIRGREDTWAGKWIRYHRALQASRLDLKVVELAALLNPEESLFEDLVKSLDLSYDPAIRQYWNFEHHATYGSTTARARLHAPGSAEHSREVERSVKVNDEAKPRPASIDEVVEIGEIVQWLESGAPIVSRSVRGELALRQSALRRLIERSVYRLGIDPKSAAARVSHLTRKHG